MRKVELRMNEELKYLTIKKLVETNGTKKTAPSNYNVHFLLKLSHIFY